MPKSKMPKADPELVNAFCKVIDKYIAKNPKGRASVVILSLVATWRHIYPLLPVSKAKGAGFDGTPGWISEPPRDNEVYHAS
jgi:hypothetical protein